MPYKKQIVYKVVRKHREWLASQYTYDEKLVVFYEINKWAEPKVKGTHLFAYKTLEAAKAYAGESSIFKAEAYVCDYPRIYPSSNLWNTINKIRHLLKTHKSIPKNLPNFISSSMMDCCPSFWEKSVVGCSKIKLLERIQ